MGAACRYRILCVVGTRPEAIKMAPVIFELKNSPWAEPMLVLTGQHRELVRDALADFDMKPDIDFDIMMPSQTLTDVVGALITKLGRAFDEYAPQIVLGQGDTATALAAALAAFLKGIPFGHIEAGLRSGDLSSPFPEEFNRKIATLAATIHFAPTQRAKSALLQEGVDSSTVFVTGNTGIDAVRLAKSAASPVIPKSDKALVLMTLHRRENFGERARNIFVAIRNFSLSRPDVQFVFPVHPNPQVREIAEAILGNQAGVTLLQPQSYLSMIALMNSAKIILTDSGGIQEEAPFLGKPVLVLRTETERWEAVEAGASKLVGADHQLITRELTSLLDNANFYASMARQSKIFGDGFAANRIVNALKKQLDSMHSKRGGAPNGSRITTSGSPLLVDGV
ncbi:UDP-N-acetylglucosamine 2-epimerase (non-hydrolyzing) [Ensifer sp. IC4062]|nr:UDP-N-acetylglucosamine 2-epimerase (non-hydrolyzing) [Ensifer sp. IC4062]MCA1441935.1 UDP-N-acetylglucosamine 2-epimerase (non-hydrolyzing) [Ensifer sp. IC4062]